MFFAVITLFLKCLKRLQPMGLAGAQQNVN